MFKVTRKAGIIVLLSALLLCGGIAFSVNQSSSSASTLEAKSNLEACCEAGKIVLSGHLLDFLAFEQQTFAGDIYRHRRDYSKAQANYAEAAKIAKKNFSTKSFFTYLAYECKAHAEQKADKKTEAYDDFKAGLAVLPESTAYAPYRWTTERWVIALGDVPSKESVEFYQAHLALAQKLGNGFVDRLQLINAIWEMAKVIDASGAYDWSELYWKRMTTEVRAENYPPTRLGAYLMTLAHHELEACHYSEADEALAEALKIAKDAHDDKLLASALDKRGELKLKQHNLTDAEQTFQTYLELTKKLNDTAGQSSALGYLSEVARNRGDLAAREKLLQESLQLSQTPAMKPRYLFVLACISARRKEFSQAQDYCNQWKQISLTTPPGQSYLPENELHDLIVLYPRLKDFDKLPEANGGVTFNAEQTATVVSTIGAAASPVRK